MTTSPWGLSNTWKSDLGLPHKGLGGRRPLLFPLRLRRFTPPPPPKAQRLPGPEIPSRISQEFTDERKPSPQTDSFLPLDPKSATRSCQILYPVRSPFLSSRSPGPPNTFARAGKAFCQPRRKNIFYRLKVLLVSGPHPGFSRYISAGLLEAGQSFRAQARGSHHEHQDRSPFVAAH